MIILVYLWLRIMECLSCSLSVFITYSVTAAEEQGPPAEEPTEDVSPPADVEPQEDDTLPSQAPETPTEGLFQPLPPVTKLPEEDPIAFEETLPLQVTKSRLEDIAPPEEDTDPKPLRPLIRRLTEPMFAEPSAVTQDDLQYLHQQLDGGDGDMVEVQGRDYPMSAVKTMYPDKVPAVPMMHEYCRLVQEHVTKRAKASLQQPVTILSPKTFMRPWKHFLLSNEKPELSEHSIKRCQAANRVLGILPAPLWDPLRRKYSTLVGHFILIVIDRSSQTFTIVDSWPRPPEYYEPISKFLQLITQQMNDESGDLSKAYTPSPTIPEPGFFVQPEAREHYYMPGIYNAAGPLSLENMLCIAENRRPNYKLEHIPAIRLRILRELLQGLADRDFASGGSRSATNE